MGHPLWETDLSDVSKTSQAHIDFTIRCAIMSTVEQTNANNNQTQENQNKGRDVECRL